MTDWEPGEPIELHDSVDDFIAAIHGEPTNAELACWGIYRTAVHRHYGMLTEAERDKIRPADPDVQRRQRRNRRFEATQGWATQLCNRHVVLAVAAGAALWVALWAVLKP